MFLRQTVWAITTLAFHDEIIWYLYVYGSTHVQDEVASSFKVPWILLNLLNWLIIWFMFSKFNPMILIALRDRGIKKRILRCHVLMFISHLSWGLSTSLAQIGGSFHLETCDHNPADHRSPMASQIYDWGMTPLANQLLSGISISNS